MFIYAITFCRLCLLNDPPSRRIVPAVCVVYYGQGYYICWQDDTAVKSLSRWVSRSYFALTNQTGWSDASDKTEYEPRSFFDNKRIGIALSCFFWGG